MTNKNLSGQNRLRTIALIFFLVGVIGSLYFMFKAGSEQKSILLLGLFAAWVLSPFIGLFILNKSSRKWTDNMQSRLHRLMILLTVISLTAYSGILLPQQTKAAFIFLLIPFISWIAILIVFIISRRHSSNGNNLN